MKIEKLAELTEEELRREETSLQEQIFRLRFQVQTGNAENPSKLRTTRRTLARVLTMIREHELGLAGRHRRVQAGDGQSKGGGARTKAGGSQSKKSEAK